MDDLFWFISIGLVVGVVVGLTGLGGGALMTPLLIMSGLPAIVAIGTDIVYSVVTKGYAGVIHTREGNVEYKIVAILLSGSVPGLLMGYYFSSSLLSELGQDTLNSVLTTLLSFLLISISLISLINQFWTIMRKNVFDAPDEIIEEFEQVWEQEKESGLNEVLMNQDVYFLILGAFLVGFLVQISSVGSGVLITILLLNILPSRKVVGTELTHASILILFSSFIHIQQGNVDYVVLWKIVVGSLVGVFVGIRYARRIPKDTLKIILILIILLSGVIMLFAGG